MVRFYFDADVLGLAKVVAKLRSDVTYPEIQAVSCIAESDRRARSPVLPLLMRSGFQRPPVKGG